MRLILTLLLISFPVFSQAKEWTSPERVAEASKNMGSRLSHFDQKMQSHKKYPEIQDSLEGLAQFLVQFETNVRNGMPYEEARKEFSKLSGRYHHANRRVSDTFHLNFGVMSQWRGVEWAWERVSWNMYGTVP